MRLHRFIGDFDLSQSQVLSSDRDLTHQLRNVFRLSGGDQVLLCDGRRNEAQATIIQLDSGQAVFSVTSRRQLPLADRRVDLFCAILKRENFELAVQKATECGVERIVPIITARTVKTGLPHERLQKIAREASEQCGRGNVPIVAEIMDFDAALEQAAAPIYLFDGSGQLGKLSGGKEVSIFVGPEGGWTEEEIESAKKQGAIIQSLGPLILRAETAAIVASYLAVNSI